MTKIIHAYLNDEDLSCILALLSENNMLFYNKDKTVVNEIKAISNGIPTFYISNNNSSFIEFSPCFYTLNHLQCASFRLESDKDSELSSVFKLIKKHIRLTYMLSQDKSFYIGPGIYQDWLNYKYCFPTLLKYDSFTVDERNLEILFNDIAKEGCIIKSNNVRLRNIDEINMSAESFVIFKDSSKLITTIIRKTIIRYEFGSECIFVYRKNKQKVYEFILDGRIADNSSSKITGLFSSIKRQFNELSCD